MIKKGILCARRGIKKGTFIVFVPLLLPPPPPHTHQRDSYILCFYIVFAPLPIQHSFFCSFKWMSLLKTVPQPKKILCSLFTYMVFVPLKIYHLICSVIAKKMSLFPQNAWEEICQREINVTVILSREVS